MKVSYNVITLIFENKNDWFFYWINKLISNRSKNGIVTIENLINILYIDCNVKYFKRKPGKLMKILKSHDKGFFKINKNLIYSKSDQTILNKRYEHVIRDYNIIDDDCIFKLSDFKKNVVIKFIMLFWFTSQTRLAESMKLSPRQIYRYTQNMIKMKVWQIVKKNLVEKEADHFIYEWNCHENYYLKKMQVREGRYDILKMSGVHVLRDSDYKYFRGKGLIQKNYFNNIKLLNDKKNLFIEKLPKIFEAEEILG